MYNVYNMSLDVVQCTQCTQNITAPQFLLNERYVALRPGSVGHVATRTEGIEIQGRVCQLHLIGYRNLVASIYLEIPGIITRCPAR